MNFDVGEVKLKKQKTGNVIANNNQNSNDKPTVTNQNNNIIHKVATKKKPIIKNIGNLSDPISANRKDETTGNNQTSNISKVIPQKNNNAKIIEIPMATMPDNLGVVEKEKKKINPKPIKKIVDKKTEMKKSEEDNEQKDEDNEQKDEDNEQKNEEDEEEEDDKKEWSIFGINGNLLAAVSIVGMVVKLFK